MSFSGNNYFKIVCNISLCNTKIFIYLKKNIYIYIFSHSNDTFFTSPVTYLNTITNFSFSLFPTLSLSIPRSFSFSFSLTPFLSSPFQCDNNVSICYTKIKSNIILNYISFFFLIMLNFKINKLFSISIVNFM